MCVCVLDDEIIWNATNGVVVGLYIFQAHIYIMKMRASWMFSGMKLNIIVSRACVRACVGRCMWYAKRISEAKIEEGRGTRKN